MTAAAPYHTKSLEDDVPIPAVDALRRRIEAEMDEDDADDALLELMEGKEEDYKALQGEIASSSDLLTNLADFLGKFQVDLAAVSGELQDLRERSVAIERRGGGRRTIEKPLSALVGSITIPPELVNLILDSQVSEAWFPAVDELDRLLMEIDRRKGRVRAVGELEKVADGLRNTATTKIRAHLLNLLRPLSASVTANVPILQTSIILRHRPLYLFLYRQNRPVALEIRRAYVWRARGYFETGFRRFARNVGLVAARNTDTFDLIGLTPSAGPLAPPPPSSNSLSVSTSSHRSSIAETRTLSAQELETSVVANSRIEGEGVMLAWQVDDKTFNLPVEACFRSLMLVLLDNASSEYTFLVRFFAPPSPSQPLSAPGPRLNRFFSNASTMDDVSSGERQRMQSFASIGTRTERLPSTMTLGGRDRLPSYIGEIPSLAEAGEQESVLESKEEKKEMENSWHQVFDPALDYVQAQITALLTPVPSPPHLLSLLALLAELLSAAQERGITPLEGFLIKQRLTIWPLFQKRMDEEVASVKRLVDLAAPGGGGLLGMVGVGGKVKDAKVEKIAIKYTSMFNSLSALSSEEDGPMISMSLHRLRAELAQLIDAQASKMKDPRAKEAFISGIQERIIQTVRTAFSADEQSQEEIAFWRKRTA